MKKFKLLSLIGITSLALAHAGWAAGHGGGGGGHGGGGGGFHGGGFGGGGFHGGGFRGGRFSGRNFRHHGFSNVVFIAGSAFRAWWGWEDRNGYYGSNFYRY